ncbi:MAG: NAD(P)/FAD-dependent oxidoreductase [Lachnospiraceae bacterium]
MKEVVIIGAGPAGLTAAYELLKQDSGCKVMILEESDAIGGISRTVCYHGNRMDIGGHRFFSKDERIMDWWKSILPMQGAPSYDDKRLGRVKTLCSGGPDPEKEDRVMLNRQRVSRIYYNRKFFDYPITMKPQTFINMGLQKTVLAGCSYLKACIHKRDEDSLENFYINRFGKVLYSMFFEGYTEKLWGRHPREIAADWGSQRVKGLSILGIIKDMFGKLNPHGNRKVETSLIEEFIYPKLGPGQLWETVADEIRSMGGSIQFHSKAEGILLSRNQVTGIRCLDTETGEKLTVEGDVFLSSMPLCDLIDGMGNTVPSEVQRVAKGLPYRDFVTVGLLLNRLNLKNETEIRTIRNRVPDCWIYVQDTKVKLGRIQIFNNWSPYLVKNPEQTVWIGLEYFCKEGDDFWNMNDQQSVDLAVNELVKMGIIDGPENVLDSHRERVKKAYPAYFDTYEEIDKVISYINAIENLYCIGRNGQHRYNNMDHSMATAFEAVDIIMNRSEDKSAIWNVNTEKEYHETKK